MLFTSWKEKVREFFEPYDNKKNRETQKSIPSLAINENYDNIYRDGSIMLFPTNLSGSEWCLGEGNPNSIPTFSTNSCNDNNNKKIIKKKERNIAYWNIKSGNITYRSSDKKGQAVNSTYFQVQPDKLAIGILQ